MGIETVSPRSLCPAPTGTAATSLSSTDAVSIGVAMDIINATLHAADGRAISARFAVYRAVLGSDWLVADVEVDGRSLFEALLYR